MPSFTCTMCGTSFTLPQATLDKYPRWTPRECMDCKRGVPFDKRARPSSSAAAPASPAHAAPSAQSKAPAAAQSSGRSAGLSATVEENLPLAAVLARYTKGPDTGVFTDGACQPNPGPGGWGVVHVDGGRIVGQWYGSAPQTTNNRMELTALIEAFKQLSVDTTVTVYSDSKLCIQTLDEWAHGWMKNGWRKKGGEVKNLDLVKEAFALRTARPKLRLQHIAAHSGNRWNEYADSLSTAWTRQTL